MSINSCESQEKSDQDMEHLPKFLKLLYQILEKGDFEEYITWSPDGRSVIIMKPVEFSERLLPVYFKHSNYSSFVRQLNLYNFRKKKDQNYDNVFTNPMFVKGRRDLLPFIKRKCTNVAQGFTNYVPSENFSYERVEYGKLLEENVSLKRSQEQMVEKIVSLERVVKRLTDDNENIQNQYSKKRHNEEILKKAIGNFAKEFGQKAIGEITASALLSSSEDNCSSHRPRTQTFLSGNTYNSPLYPTHEPEDNLLHQDDHNLTNPLYVKTVSTTSTNEDFPMSSYLGRSTDTLESLFHHSDNENLTKKPYLKLKTSNYISSNFQELRDSIFLDA